MENKKCINGVRVFSEIICENKEYVILNPDDKIVEKITNRIKINNGHCPCQLEKTSDTICPCKPLKKNGICHCNLYKKVEYQII